jgi:hypothetical protein
MPACARKSLVFQNDLAYRNRAGGAKQGRGADWKPFIVSEPASSVWIGIIM